MDYDVITIDTSIFEQHGLKLEVGLLRQLAQFKEGSAEFVMPDVIHQELIRHLRLKTCEASKSLSRIPKMIEELCLLEKGQRVEVNKILDKIYLPGDIVDARLKVFKENTGLIILRCGEFVDVDEILVRYHETRLPFAGKKNKKAEFPDAFALLCLENWAKKNDKKILAISNDRGWQEFGEISSHIDVIEGLSEALEKFQQGVSKAMKYASIFLEQLYDGKRPADMEGIKDTLIDEIPNLTPLVEFDSEFPCDPEDIYLEFRGFKFCPDKFDKESTHLVRVGRNEIVILMRIEMSVGVLVKFQLRVDDAMDKDYVSIGNQYIEREDEIQLKVLLTLNCEEGTVKLIETELTSDNDYPVIDFGFIAFDWSGARYL